MTGLIVFCSLVFAAGLILGLLVGEWWGDRTARRDVADERAGERAAGQFRAMREPASVSEALAAVRAGRAYYRQPPEVAHEWEAHVGQALAITRPALTDTGWTQAAGEWLDGEIARRHADTDRWLAEHVYGVPYSADELWSGQ